MEIKLLAQLIWLLFFSSFLFGASERTYSWITKQSRGSLWSVLLAIVYTASLLVFVPFIR